MSITVNEGGVLYELDKVTVNEGGVLYELDSVTSNEGGVLFEIFSSSKALTGLSWSLTGTDSGASIDYQSDDGTMVTFTSGGTSNSVESITSNFFTLNAGDTICYTHKTQYGTGTRYYYFRVYDQNGTLTSVSDNARTFTADTTGNYRIVIGGFSSYKSNNPYAVTYEYDPITSTVQVGYELTYISMPALTWTVIGTGTCSSYMSNNELTISLVSTCNTHTTASDVPDARSSVFHLPACSVIFGFNSVTYTGYSNYSAWSSSGINAIYLYKTDLTEGDTPTSVGTEVIYLNGGTGNRGNKFSSIVSLEEGNYYIYINTSACAPYKTTNYFPIYGSYALSLFLNA